MSSPLIVARCSLAAICLGLLATACAIATPAPSGSSASARQRVVDAVAALTRGQLAPQHFLKSDAAKIGGEFDPNQLFTTLDHLSMEPGYALDYVYYYAEIGGKPVLYARPADQPAYPNYSAYAKALGKDPFSEAPFDYLDHVRVDGTADGFFQLIVMRVMGHQFYLYWHAKYDDATVVCDRAALEAILSPQGEGGLEIPQDVQEQARTLNPAPTVEFQGDKVVVKVLVFSKWGGFFRETYTISRSFPHQVLDAQQETLVPYDCGIQF